MVTTGTQTSNPAGSPKLTPAKSNPEFERFQDLTKKLTQVPKSEIDEKRKG